MLWKLLKKLWNNLMSFKDFKPSFYMTKNLKDGKFGNTER
jgi:hypothetical protein